jgi:AcrR family transcriptional regulator
LTKGALYGNFPDKEALAAQAFAYATQTVRELIRDTLKPVPTFRAKLFALFDFFAGYVLAPPIPGGCPLLNTAVEADDNRVSIRPVVGNEITQVVNFMATLIRKGIRSGEFKQNTDPRELAYVFFCALEGAIMFSRVEGSSEPMDIVVNHCKDKLDQITHPLWNKNG